MNAGGTVVVLARDTEAFSPYQLKLRFDPVTDENAPVAFLEPGAPLLAFPNRISEDDFRGWKQDRCVYLPAEPLDPAFEELLSLDRAGSPARGAYLFARYGKGNFVISTLSWFRQLRESNPGALRNLANMISLPTAPSE
jgi:hypothetical protein